MSTPSTTRRSERITRALLERHGTTYAEQAGITMRNTPAPLYRLLVLATLLSARIRAEVAVAAAKELRAAGLGTPERMRASTWQARVDALGRGGYRRFDERTATVLGSAADLIRQTYRDDLRRLLDAADSPEDVRRRLEAFPGVGPTGSGIFCREVQGVWPDLAPFLDQRVLDGAAVLGLPTTQRALVRLVEPHDLPRFAAACVRATLDRDVVPDVRDAVA